MPGGYADTGHVEHIVDFKRLDVRAIVGAQEQCIYKGSRHRQTFEARKRTPLSSNAYKLCVYLQLLQERRVCAFASNYLIAHFHFIGHVQRYQARQIL